MKHLRDATEHEMVLAFLQGEIDSPRFGPYYADILSRSGLNRSTLIDKADIRDAHDNAVRTGLLRAVRGFGANNALFSGFPQDASWRRIELDSSDYQVLKFANYPTWVELSGGTRLVVDGARNLEKLAAAEDASKNVKAVAAELQMGRRYPELIAVQGENCELILVEGHTRATAYVHTGMDPGEILVATSPQIKQWRFY